MPWVSRTRGGQRTVSKRAECVPLRTRGTQENGSLRLQNLQSIYLCWMLSSCAFLTLPGVHVPGGKTDKNAHPHMDFDNRIALVHNGTINNASELRRELLAKGIDFRSETDTEVSEWVGGWCISLRPA